VSGPRAARRTPSTSLADLATLLARAYLRLSETSRRGAVSCVDAEQNPLEVARPKRPDVVAVPQTRRAS
jgi:hypothetical protein